MDEPDMAAWWTREITGEHRDAWCEALDDGPITTEMALTIAPGFLDHGPRDWLTTDPGAASGKVWTMTADFRAFIAEKCAQRLR